jgi:putative aldouronate transport system permease protein
MDDFELTLLAMPTVIWYILFTYLPMFGIIIAFKRIRAPKRGVGFLTHILTSENAGLDNFRFVFGGRDASLMFRNTSDTIQCLSSWHGHRGRSSADDFTAAFKTTGQSRPDSHVFAALPVLVVVSYFVFSFLSMDKGLINTFLSEAGRDSIQWYMQPKYWPYILIFLNLWKGTGYGMVVYLASISGIDGELYEAAIIDGAKKSQQIKYSTLPLLKPIILIMFILAVGRIFSTDFGLFYQVPRNSGPLVDVTQTIDVYVFKALMGNPNYGFAAAAGLLQSVFGLITILIANAVVRRIDAENALF